MEFSEYYSTEDAQGNAIDVTLSMPFPPYHAKGNK
jgi:hypothetical protein